MMGLLAAAVHLLVGAFEAGSIDENSRPNSSPVTPSPLSQ